MNTIFKNQLHFKYLLYKLIILVFSIFLLSKIKHTSLLNLQSISNRIMEQNETKNNSDDNYTEYLTEIFTENIMEDSTNTTENLTDNNNSEISGGALTGGFLFFCILALYIIFKLNSFGYNQEQKNNVWYFLYMANNGTLIANGINILNIFDPNSGVLGEILNYGPCALTCIIFLVGLCILLCKLKCSFAFFESHFEFNTFCYLFGLIKFMWSLLGLTDPCCRINTVTVRVYADGHTEDDSCCVCIWNAFIYFLKRLSFVYSVIAFMIFYIFYLFIFILAKLIYLLMITTCLKNKYQEYIEQINQKNAIPENIPQIQNNNNYQNNYNSNDQIIIPMQNIPVNNNNYGNLNYNNNGNFINNNIQNGNPVFNLQIGNIQINSNNLRNMNNNNEQDDQDGQDEQDEQDEQNEQYDQNEQNEQYEISEHQNQNSNINENHMTNRPEHLNMQELPSRDEVISYNNQRYINQGQINNYNSNENQNITNNNLENRSENEGNEDNCPPPIQNSEDRNLNQKNNIDNFIINDIHFSNNINMGNEE